MDRYRVFRAWQRVGVKQYDEAEKILDELFEKGVDASSEHVGTWDGTSVMEMFQLKGQCLIQRGQLAEAKARLQEAEELWDEIPDHLRGKPSLTRMRMRINLLQPLIQVYEALEGPETSEADRNQLTDYRTELAKCQADIARICQ